MEFLVYERYCCGFESVGTFRLKKKNGENGKMVCKICRRGERDSFRYGQCSTLGLLRVFFICETMEGIRG